VLQNQCLLVDGDDIDLLGLEGVPEDDTANTTCTWSAPSRGNPEMKLTETVQGDGSRLGQCSPRSSSCLPVDTDSDLKGELASPGPAECFSVLTILNSILGGRGSKERRATRITGLSVFIRRGQLSITHRCHRRLIRIPDAARLFGNDQNAFFAPKRRHHYP
jgi:hypothetical protein